MGLRRWLRRSPSDGEIRAELESHLAMRAEHDGAGEPAAHRKLGNLLRTQEDVRRVWRPEFWETVAQDLRFVFRAWLRNPAFTLAGLSAMALGLGAAIGLFSMVDRILFRSLPYQESDRLVSVGLTAPIDANEFMLSPDYLLLWRDTPAPFESVTTITAGNTACDLTEVRPERLTCAVVESNLLKTLKVSVAAGRDLSPTEGRPGGGRAALISHGLWLRRFGSDSRIQGRRLVLDGEPVEIAGVLPRDFELPTLGSADVLLPQQLITPQAGRPAPMTVLRAFARLKPGVTSAQAHAALQPLFAEMLKNVPPAFRAEVALRVRPLRDRQTGDARKTAWLLLAAVGGLVLLVCTNVTNLLLARMASRERELAVRASLGASRARLARLVLTESLLLACAGAVSGLLVAHVLLKIAVSVAPASIPKLTQASIDFRVLAAAAGLALLSTVLIGISPALSVARTGSLSGSRTIGNVRPWTRLALVSMQIALALTLLTTSTLLIRSVWSLQRVALGFDVENVLSASLTLSRGKYRSQEQQLAFFEQLLERVRRMPGMQSVALSDSLPPHSAARSMIYSRIEVEGRPSPRQGTGGMVTWRSVTPGYFEALRIPIVRGHSFSDQDRHAAEPALILSERLARRLFPQESALGKRLRPGGGSQPWHVIVGVAKDIRNVGPAADSEPEFYVARRPIPSDAERRSFLIVRTQLAPAAVIKLLRAEITGLDPQLPVLFQTMADRVGELAARPRFTAWLLTSFAGLALVLACTGLAGIAAFLVVQRTRDFGVRMALGATPDRIRGTVFREASTWITAGSLLGLGFSWGCARFLGSFLHGVTAWDPLTWTISLLVLTATLGASVLRPALRAASIDPSVALRAE